MRENDEGVRRDAEGRGDVDDLIFDTENGWYVSDR